MPLRIWLEYLDWEGSDAQAMSAMELEGYLTGLVLTPSYAPSVPWRWEVWGTQGPVPFFDEPHMKRVTGALLDYYNDLRASIVIGPRAFSPLCLPVEGDPDLWEVRVWATGFMLGLESDPGYWRRMMADDRGGFALTPITMFFPDAEGRYHDPANADEREATSIAARTIPHCVAALWALGESAIVVRTKVGRNEQCPCGSGKKYKMCCGR